MEEHQNHVHKKRQLDLLSKKLRCEYIQNETISLHWKHVQINWAFRCLFLVCLLCVFGCVMEVNKIWAILISFTSLVLFDFMADFWLIKWMTPTYDSLARTRTFSYVYGIHFGHRKINTQTLPNGKKILQNGNFFL